MKLTKRIFVLVVMLAVLVSSFVFASSAEFTEDNIEDILEYLEANNYPQYLKEDYENYANTEYQGTSGLHESVTVRFESDGAEVGSDPADQYNNVLKYEYVAQDKDPRYLKYELDFSNKITEIVFSMKVRADKGWSEKAPVYSIDIGAYDKDGDPIGEDSLVTVLTLDFETGEIIYAEANANYVKNSESEEPAFDNGAVSDFTVDSDVWYTVNLIVDCKTGSYNFIIASDDGETYESSDITLGEINEFDKVETKFTMLPIDIGAKCYFDDFKVYRGTFLRGDESVNEATAIALYNISTLLEDEELDIETQLRIVDVYKAIIASGYVPEFTNKFDKYTVTELYESAKAYIPATYTKVFCNEAETIDTTISYTERLEKLAAIESYMPHMNGKDFYLSNIEAALSELEDAVSTKFSAELNTVLGELAAEALGADKKAELEEKRDAISKLMDDAETTINNYKNSLAENADAETRIETLEETLDELLYDYDELLEVLYSTIEAVEENEELLAKVVAAIAAYDAEVQKLDEAREDSDAFIACMSSYDSGSRDYTYIMDTYAHLTEFSARDNSYEGVEQYVQAFDALALKVQSITRANIAQFQDAVAVMKKENASFSEIYYNGYLIAKEVYNNGIVRLNADIVDIATIPGLVNDIAKYLEIEATLTVTVDACEDFISKVNAAKENNLYAAKKEALEKAKEALNKEDNKINEAYNGVTDAKNNIALVEAEIVALEKAAADYIAAVEAIGTKNGFNEKKTAVAEAYKLQKTGNVVGFTGVAQANSSLANYSAALDVLEGNSITFVESVKMLGEEGLTLAQRRELIIIADRAKDNTEPTYAGVAEAKVAIEVYKQAYKDEVAAINSAFNTEVTNSASVAGASVNQSRFYSVIEIVKLLVAKFANWA